MSTPLIWVAGEIYHTMFQQFWRYPMRYSPQRKLLMYDLDVKEFRRWKFRNMYCAGTILLLISVEKLSTAMKQDKVPYFQIVLYCMCIFLSLLNMVIPRLLIRYGELATSSINFVLLTERDIKAAYPEMFVTRRWDIRGLLLCAAASFLAIVPYFSLLFIPKRNILSLMANRLFRSVENSYTEFLVSIPCYIIFGVVKFIVVFETCRSLCAIFLLCTLITEVMQKMMSDIMELGSKSHSRFRQLCAWYNGIILCTITNHIGLANVVSVLMGAGLVLSVVSNTVTIKLHSVVPKPFYFLFPGVSILIPFMINATLPSGINIHLKSKELLRVWNNHIPYSRNNGVCDLNKSYLVRKLKALRFIMIYAGIEGHNFFSFSRELELNYYSTITGFTIDAILSLP
jgi:hypothetical protein